MDVSSKQKILIVDDEKINVAILTSYLCETYDVITAPTGKEGLELVKKEEPDLILLDVVMPGMDGFDVCRIIKKDYELDFIPVIMLTSLTSRDDHQKGIEVGADDFLKKPADRFELDKKITSLLRIKEQHDSLLTELDKAHKYLDYVGILIAVLDPEYKLIHINKKGADFLGYNRINIMNRNWIDLFVIDSCTRDVKSTYDNLQRGLIEQNEYHEYPLVTKTGKEKLFKWYDSVLTDSKGDVTGILISGEDITEKRKAEIKLMEYASQLERSNELKDLFTDVLRHDLLNPAGLIKSFTEILEETDTDEKQKHLIGNINRSTSKLIDLIEGAARLAKLESIEEVTFVRYDIGSILQDVVNRYSPDIDKKRIKLDKLPDHSYPAMVNPMIEGVFSNLLSNAIKYSPDDSTIEIKIDDLQDKWKFSITDQGDGVPDLEKAKVFERFKRLHKENVRGTGIGLAIVKRIIDLHDEDVGVADNPEGQGSIFWLTLKKA
ncbi:response regulator [Methanolobus halotolerans]|uniref:Hybrid sensor histidine kinase/response regulator n=1 Tax=Methanolobus halotolerans TaxID=2052935 RepID=A0A4E0R0C1_9EURY|nr:response regulator [Methanolobus halotolerans]TGC09746.1 hybrid sensor histidine kinase/response regulator [Methanolobus halotolerans]